ncbi:MAG TPA: winged helix-turn-helix domain-containing tetratricopeptide repeat protein [Vicinamibacterales bacterium]
MLTGELLDFRFADFEIDVARHELRRAGAVVHIEPQVFDLIVHLVKNRERIVSKDELIEAIWQGRIISEAALSSRISAARRALGDSGNDQSLIRTLHKRGFRFVGDVEEVAAAAAVAAAEAAPAPPAAKDAPQLVPSTEPLPLPDKPSIAVLPFQNMSRDPDQEYFADGLTEDIITGLSRQRWFFVIARNSSFTFKGQAVDVRDVATQLGVRYVLEGSVRKAENRVRVTGQLIDAANGNHLWAERYDRELADIFALQDEITTRVIGSVGPQILVAEAARVRRKPPQSIDAWDLVMQAVPHMWRMSVQEHGRAQELLQQAVDLDPNYAHAHALLGWTYITMFNLDTRRPIGEFTNKALAAGARAVMLDDDEPWAHLVVGLGHARQRRSQLAFRHLTKSVELNPSFALGHAGLGYALGVGGQPESGLQALEEALRLSPRDPFLAVYAPTVRYMSLFALERYEEAIAVCRSTVALHPHHAGAWRLMTVSLGMLERTDEAKEALVRTLTMQPDLSSAHVANDTVYSNPADRERFLEGLRRAGLKN